MNTEGLRKILRVLQVAGIPSGSVASIRMMPLGQTMPLAAPYYHPCADQAYSICMICAGTQRKKLERIATFVPAFFAIFHFYSPAVFLPQGCPIFITSFRLPTALKSLSHSQVNIIPLGSHQFPASEPPGKSGT